MDYLQQIKSGQVNINLPPPHKVEEMSRIRKKIAEEINKIYKNFNWATIISKNSTINGNVRIGKGSLIVSGAVINTGTKIGEHCLINTSSSIDHDNTFKNYSSTGPSVTTGGNVELGQCSHLGTGSTVKHQISIGDNTIIAVSYTHLTLPTNREV